MAHEYNVDEFLGFDNAQNDTFRDEVDKKISLLYDFAILHKRRYNKPDEKEEAVRNLLLSYNSGILMDNAIRGVLTKERTLDQLLERKGFLN